MIIHIFRRDLRVFDNTALVNANEEVLPVFIFDPRQVDSNDYRSDAAVQFMLESLKDLDEQLDYKLQYFYGDPIEVLQQLCKKNKITAISVNKDYTPFSQKRDKKIAELCEELKISFNQYDDVLLFPPEEIKKDDGGYYTVFTPFYKKAQQYSIAEPKNPTLTLVKPDKKEQYFDKVLKKRRELFIKGGRKEALQLLGKACNLDDYKKERDFPQKAYTSGLSAHHKFGTISIRESFHTLKDNESLVRQLYWRDFFTQIAFHKPEVFGHAFQDKYEHIKWENDEKLFKAWCEGKTGYPIVDAAMRELNQTGYMHNRCRMIVASFLTKDLLIDWRWGEKYFAQRLIDYDPAVNNGSWQWAASTGCDAQPYFRIFNPWLQQKKFDTDAVYIKKWVPELQDVDVKTIHGLDKQSIISDYPKPIVDHYQQRDKALALFKSL